MKHSVKKNDSSKTGSSRKTRNLPAENPSVSSPDRRDRRRDAERGEAGFAELGLGGGALAALAAAGYDQPTPIQIQAIPPGLAGRDLLGCAQTGTGKTAAFALPILQRLAGSPGDGIRALVLAPTRELAAQIGASFERYGRRSGLRTTVVFGGVSKRPQVSALRRGVDVLVATPGRLLDLLGERSLSLASVEVLVLDEADRMLDMGFVHDVRRVVRAIPRQRQTMLFSATLPAEIRELAEEVLVDPVRVAVTPVASTVDSTEQRVYAVEKPDKLSLLLTLLQDPELERVLVFTRTKHGADKVAKKLTRAGVETAALHGNKSQGARERALDGFKQGRVRVIVATDIAARGLDVKGLSHVVNHDLPNEPETYVHRIGRTGRAGAVGVAISFCASEEREHLAGIERLTRRRLDRTDTPELVEVVLAPLPPRPARAEGGRGRSRSDRPARPSAGPNAGGRNAGGRTRGRKADGGASAPTRRPGGNRGEDAADGTGRPPRRGEPERGPRRARRSDTRQAGGRPGGGAAAGGDAKGATPWWERARDSGAGGARRRRTRRAG